MAEKVKGTTKSGFKFSIDSNIFNDWRFLRAARRATEADGETQIDASLELVALIFNDQKEEERFYQFLADQNGGRVPVELVGSEVGEIMAVIQEKSKEAKNS